MIKSIHLFNWKTHIDTKLKFGKGTNMILGPMGSGKSSVLDGISFSLFGSFPALERRSISLSDVLSHGSDEAKIILEFSFKRSNYRIERTVVKKGKRMISDAKIYENDSLKEKGQRNVTEYLSLLLAMDYDLFTRAIYSEQNNLEYFLDLEPSKRKREIDRLLGFDRFESARANTHTLLNRFKKKAGELSSLYKGKSIKEISKKLDEKKKEADSLKEKILRIKKEGSSLVGKLKEIREKKKKFEEMEKENERLSNRLTVHSTQISSMEKELLSFDSLPNEKELNEKQFSLNKTVSELKESLFSLKERAQQVSSKIVLLREKMEEKEKATSSIKNIEKQLSSILEGNTIDDCRKNTDLKRNELTKILSSISSIKNRVQELERLSPSLKKGLSSCPLCSSSLTEESVEHIKQEKEKEAKELENRTTILLESKSKIEDELKLIEKNLSVSVSLLQKKEFFSSRIAGIKEENPEAFKNELVFLQKEIKEKEDKKEKQEKELSSTSLVLRDIKRKQSLEKRKEEIKKEFEETRKKLDSLSYNKEERNNVWEEYNSLYSAYEKTKSEFVFLKKQEDSAEEIIAMLEKELKETEELKKKAEYYFSLSEQLALYRSVLEETQKELREELTLSIARALNEIWSVVYPYSNYKGIRIQVSEKDYWFEVYDGKWRKLESVASGGEKATISLVFRIALASILTPNMSWLILDEPTHNIDRNGVQLLSNALQEDIPRIVEQIFVITHEENLSSSEFAHTYNFEKENMTTKIRDILSQSQ
ncbi:SMC family ATPase [Candidatus Micrarchaeota archaeon]|nr:SMC family ATPase [Candidatus Micrarchaeota archaeon]